MTYASGKHAFGFCDRTGFRYRLRDLVWEYTDGKRTGLRVGRDVVDLPHPQDSLGKFKIRDPQSLRDPRPDTGQAESRALFGWKPVGNPLTVMVGSVGTVTVTTP